MRRNLSGGIEHEHFGQTVLIERSTADNLTFCFLGIASRRSVSNRPRAIIVSSATY